MRKTRFTYTVLFSLLCAAVLLAALAACGTKTALQDSSVPQDVSTPELPRETVSSPEETESKPVPSVDKTARMPLENNNYKRAELENYHTFGAQIFTDDGGEMRDVPYAIAAAIYQYRDYHNTLIFSESFEDITTLPVSTLVEIAASQAPHIDLYGETFQNAHGHPIKEFVEQLEAAGKTIGLIAYGDDTRAKAAELFGEDYELPREDGRTIQYNAALDLYYLDTEGATMSTDYPILTEWRRTEDLNVYTAKVIRMCYWDFLRSWSSPDGSWESEENCDIQTLCEYVNTNFTAFPQDTYVLSGPDRDSLRVIGYHPA